MRACEAIEILTEDGCCLRGQWWRGDGGWVALAHDAGGDLDDWRPLAGWLAGEGWNVLAVDARGHGGSSGTWHEEAVGADVAAMVRFAAARGSGPIYLGLGNAAHRHVCGEQPAPGVAGVFAFGPAASGYRLRVPCLAICGGPEARAVSGQGMIHERLTVAVHFPSGRVGLDLLRGSWSRHACECVAAHLRLWRGLAGLAAVRSGEVRAGARD